MRILRLGLVTLAVSAAIGACITFGVQWTVEGVVSRDASEKAGRWGEFVVSRMPRLEALLATGVPDQEQQHVIRDVRTLGDVFRFKLFDMQGRMALISDDSTLAGPVGVADEADAEALEVIETRHSIVEVNDGRHKPDRPDLYVEAYIPVLSDDGALMAVAEVYVDQTATQAYFVNSFRLFGVVLTIACLGVFAAPTTAYLFQRRAAERARNNAEYLARYDPLTGLLNRRELVERVQSGEGAAPSAVAFLDIDQFKRINDTLGHDAGDALLIHVAEALRRFAGPKDLIARFGGDEFVIAVHDLGLDTIDQRMGALLRECARRIDHRGAAVCGSVSIGVSVLGAATELETALNEANAALHSARQSGRNTYAVYGEEIGERLRHRRRVEARLRDALEYDQFSLHYQPLIDASSGETVGYEGLLRLSDGEGGAISPAVFIPIAEDMDIICEIGRWVIETGVGEAANWSGGQTLALNLSPKQFETGDLVAVVRDALASSGLPAQRLELEITESLLLTDEASVQLQLNELKEIGVSIALDDFGTGFSSLSYLWKYGFDKLKIDRSFVAALEHSPERAKEIIETIVLLCVRLGMKVTAEGIETENQSKALSEIGCDVLQGYLYGRPAPIAAGARDAAPSDVAAAPGLAAS